MCGQKLTVDHLSSAVFYQKGVVGGLVQAKIRRQNVLDKAFTQMRCQKELGQ